MPDLGKSICVVACCGIAGMAMAQDKNSALTLGREVSATLAADGLAEYVVDLEAGQFVYGELDQRDADFEVTVYDPTGDIAGTFNESQRGTDPVQLEVDLAGTYRFHVAPKDEEPGSFTFSLQRIEPEAIDPGQRLDQLLSAFTGDDVPGGIVAVMHDGKIIHSQAVGMANLTFGIPFDRDTVSNIGSVSKQFTAFAITSLAASGKLSLDDDVRQYFPEIPDLGHTVTVRHLLNHTSGYREFLNLIAMAGVRLGEGDFIDRDEILRILERQPELQDEPGTKFNYNNTAYALASLLVERVTEQPFNQWMAENVFAPIGMSDTRIRAHTGEIIPNAADGYLYGEQMPFRQAIDLGGGGGATMGPGGVYTTVDDMARWIDNLHTAKHGGAQVIGEMTKPQIDTPGGEDRHYGLGLSLEDYRGQPLIQHGGADTAHRAMMLFFPDFNGAVFAMSNNGAFGSGTIARRTADAFFSEHFEPEEDDQAAASGEAADSGDETDASQIDPSVFEPHLGKYELDDFPGIVLTVSLEDQQLSVQFTGDDPQPVSPRTETILALPPDSTLEFHIAENGKADSVTVAGSSVFQAQRLADWAPTEADLAEYEGRYFSEELETFYTVQMGDEGLLIKHRRLEDIEMTPKVEDSFSAEFPIADVAFDRNDAGELTGIRVSNGRTKNIWFAKQD